MPALLDLSEVERVDLDALAATHPALRAPLSRGDFRERRLGPLWRGVARSDGVCLLGMDDEK